LASIPPVIENALEENDYDVGDNYDNFIKKVPIIGPIKEMKDRLILSLIKKLSLFIEYMINLMKNGWLLSII